MRRLLEIVCLLLVVHLGSVARAQQAPAPLLLNGAPLRGEIVSVRPEGIEVQSGGTSRVVPWYAFAPGTRFRYDPLYRANVKAAQQGMPPTRWPNPADGELSAAPREGARAADPAPPAPTEAIPRATFRPLSFAELPPIPPLRRGALVPLDRALDARATAWGLQYGAGHGDWILFVAEPGGQDGLPAALHIWTVSAKKPERIAATRHSEGDETRAVFRDVRFQTTREEAAIEYRVSVSASTRAPGSLLISAEITLRRDGVASRFALVGTPPGVVVGDVPISPRDLLAPPNLQMAMDSAGGKPVYAGNIRMGRLRLVPRSGMERAVAVSIREENGQEVLKDSFVCGGESPVDKYSFTVPLSALKKGGKYAIRASINLGPFLGVAEYQENFVMN